MVRILFILLCPSFLFALPGNPGLKFIENKNQWPRSVNYVARIDGGSMILQPGKIMYCFYDEKYLEDLHLQHHGLPSALDESQPSGMVRGHMVEASFVGANPAMCVEASGRSVEYYNYFHGRDPSHWGTRAYAYDKVIYANLYNGVDMHIYSNGSHGKYDLFVQPQQDPGEIKIQYQGADELKLDNGNLYVNMSIAQVIERKPYAYQIIEGKRREVKCEYHLEGNILSFYFPERYDKCEVLIIDPQLIFSTYSGSTADNWGSTATPGEHGKLYSSGITNPGQGGGTFPATPGAFQTSYGSLYDIGILKYDSLGQQLLYASYLGGSNSESPHSLVMNNNEELIVFGTTASTDFPTSASAYDKSFNGGSYIEHVFRYNDGSDIFLTRISKDGTQLLASTYIGGSGNDGLNPQQSMCYRNYGDELRGDVITDAHGNIFVSSVTSSSDFPGPKLTGATYAGGLTDAVIFKMDENLSQINWSMYFGGGRDDNANTIKFDSNGDIVVAGGTSSFNFISFPSAYQPYLEEELDGWIAILSKDGSKVNSFTYTGTEDDDQVYFVDLNEQDEIFVYGQTDGSMPITPNVYSQSNSGQFLQKFSHDLTTLKFSTVFGTGKGSPDISPTAFLVNDCNNIYMSGWGGSLNNRSGGWDTSTSNLPVTPDAIQKTTSGNDFYFIVLKDDASELLYATFLGGTQSLTHVDGGTSRFDKSGIVYHAVCSGCAAGNPSGHSTSDFPTTPLAWSRKNRSWNCNNAAFKMDLASLRAVLQTNSVRFDLPGLSVVCIPDPIVFQNKSSGGKTFYWDLGDGTTLVKADTAYIVHQYKSIGRYKVTLKAVDPGTCKVRDSTYKYVDVFNAEAEIQDDDDLCEDSPYTLKASGGATYHWISKDKTFESDLPNPVVSPKDTTIYYITVTEASGCVHKDTVQLNVIPIIRPDFEIERIADCFTTPGVRVKNLTNKDSLRDGDKIYFDFGDGSTSDVDEGYHKFEKDGNYQVKLVGVREFCVTEKTMALPFMKLKVPNVITPGKNDKLNDTFVIQFGDEAGVTPVQYGYKVSLTIYNRWGSKVYEADDYHYDWSGEGLPAGIYYYEVKVQDHATCKSWIQLIK
jgi:hypothetical protein